MKSILVTGASGFIGSNFVDYVLNNYDDVHITGIDNFSTGNIDNLSHAFAFPNRFHFIKSDVADFVSPDLFKMLHVDAVFHFAALPRIQPSYETIVEHHENNVSRSLLIIESIIKAESWNTKFIYSGSSAIFGNPKQIPTPETEEVNPLSPYGFQKFEVQKYLQLLGERYKEFKHVTLLYYNPYGPRSYNPENKFSAYSSVIGIFKHRKEQGLPLLVTGDGSQSRDFIHVEDIARANWLAFENYKQNDVYNVGTGTTYKIIDIAKMISDKIEFIPARQGEAIITCADSSKIERELGVVFNADLRI